MNSIDTSERFNPKGNYFGPCEDLEGGRLRPDVAANEPSDAFPLGPLLIQIPSNAALECAPPGILTGAL